MIVFDTLELVKELEVAGFPPNQAEAQTRVLVKLLQRVDDARQDQLATRQEVVSLDAKMELRTAELKRDIKELDSKLETRLKELDVKLETRLKELEYRMVIKMGAMILAGIGILFGLMRAWPLPVQYVPTPGQEMRLPVVPLPPGR